MKVIRRGRGRPRKFGRAARAVTMTLPEDVIAALTRLDEDLSCAVGRIAQPLVAGINAHPAAELAKYGDSAVIIIRKIAMLEQIRGVTLVLPDGCALISLDQSLGLADFELKLRDAIDEVSDLSPDHSTLVSIADILKTARRTGGVTLYQRSIIVLQSNRQQRIVGA